MFQPSKLYLPALIIVAVILTLLVFIGFSTYWNLDRARTNALNFVHQQGVAILEAMRAGMTAIPHEADDTPRILAKLIRETAQNRSVAYIYLTTSNREAPIHSSKFSSDKYGVWYPEKAAFKPIASRFRRLPDNTPLYELAERFNNEQLESSVLVIGLKMSTSESARQEDFHHAIIMVSILAALGAGAVFFIYVINRYHRMNKTLRQTQEYTRQVVDSMANGLLSIDAEGRLASWNTLGLELLGLNASDTDSIRLDQVLDFEKSGISKTLNQCHPVMDREISIAVSGGNPMPVAVSVTPILAASGVCSGAVIILRDLREIKRLEEKVRRSEKLAALGKLAAAVAHEIRNPLSSIRGFARFLSHVLRDRPADAEYADVMVKEVDRINRVVTDLLNFARPLKLELAAVNPADLIQHAVRLVSGDAASRNIIIDTDVSRLSSSVLLDPNLMTQVLLNLLLNAMEAVGDNHYIQVGGCEKSVENKAVFWVEDDGPGIDAAEQERIFDPFFTSREKGTGLGLAIVQKIVENHQGFVKVESPVLDKETGCRLEVHIPLNVEVEEEDTEG